MRNPITTILARRREEKDEEGFETINSKYLIEFRLCGLPVTLDGPFTLTRCYHPERRLYNGFIAACEYRTDYYPNMAASFNGYDRVGIKIKPNHLLWVFANELFANICWFSNLPESQDTGWRPHIAYEKIGKTKLPKGPIKVETATVLKDGQKLWEYNFTQKRLIQF